MKKALVTVRELGCQWWPLAALAPSEAGQFLFLKLQTSLSQISRCRPYNPCNKETVGKPSSKKHIKKKHKLPPFFFKL